MAIGEFVGSCIPENLLLATEERFLGKNGTPSGSPRDLTLVYAGGQGDNKERGATVWAMKG